MSNIYRYKLSQEVIGIISAFGKLYEDLPNKESSNFYNGNKFNFGNLILSKKYGSSDFYLNRSIKRMKSWGMNTMGGWSNNNIIQANENQKVPYTISVGTLKYKVNNINYFPIPFNPNCKKSNI